MGSDLGSTNWVPGGGGTWEISGYETYIKLVGYLQMVQDAAGTGDLRRRGNVCIEGEQHLLIIGCSLPSQSSARVQGRGVCIKQC